MRIYTKTGDGGETGLYGGERVPKSHPRVAAYGDVDETNAAIGAAAAAAPPEFEAALFERIQRDLLTIGAELAAPDPMRLERALSGPPIGDSDVLELERAIDRLEGPLPPLRSFILPGGAPKAAALHLARTVCRRAERSVVTLTREVAVSSPILKYLNRLSDLLFVLARAANAHVGRGDVTW